MDWMTWITGTIESQWLRTAVVPCQTGNGLRPPKWVWSMFLEYLVAHWHNAHQPTLITRRFASNKNSTRGILWMACWYAVRTSLHFELSFKLTSSLVYIVCSAHCVGKIGFCRVSPKSSTTRLQDYKIENLDSRSGLRFSNNRTAH